MESRFHFQGEIIAKQQKQIDNIYKMIYFQSNLDSFNQSWHKVFLGYFGFI